MMLRSSSTPVLGSLLSSSSYSSESPNHENNNKNNSELNKISFPHGDREVSSTNKGFRRAQSDGNLEGLAAGASCGGDFQEFSRFSSNPSSPFKFAKRNSMLQSIPSVSDFNSRRGSEEDDYVEDEIKNDGFLPRSVTIGENIMCIGSAEFTYGEKMGLIEEKEEDKFNEFQYLGQENHMNPSLFLAKGLGIDVNGGGGGGFDFAKFGEGGVQNEEEIGEYYMKMVEENPSSALFLRNYAQFLYKSKGDLRGADEYYSRAILADPRDGKILLQYARLVWELHHDYARACSYFERALQAAPEDSHVHAAYASFLWEFGDSDEEEERSSISHNPVGIANFQAGESGVEHEEEVGEYYQKMIGENPCNSLFLRNYAQFLYKSKGDLRQADGYYSRAILIDPRDGEILSQYARLVWELHHDYARACSYFERAVQAAPEDSHIHAAYASFLWEAEDCEEENQQNSLSNNLAGTTNFHGGGSISSAYFKFLYLYK
ncbi:uncharacterized protein LOC113304360 isoform X2 [Papaver somniferum]|uniref:uncharacterized protein LOC113304360 isoform X2 n=1 Tax=Papaver somniferum TaxID=3469 RepID=UPI000E700438|nr:uncharacterized protein LOC113304360 isoform X2 [Papaver somniferum]